MMIVHLERKGCLSKLVSEEIYGSFSGADIVDYHHIAVRAEVSRLDNCTMRGGQGERA